MSGNSLSLMILNYDCFYSIHNEPTFVHDNFTLLLYMVNRHFLNLQGLLKSKNWITFRALWLLFSALEVFSVQENLH